MRRTAHATYRNVVLKEAKAARKAAAVEWPTLHWFLFWNEVLTAWLIAERNKVKWGVK